MSERGSFVTEYIYCVKCFKACERILVKDDKYLCGQSILTWQDATSKELPIIAGKIGGLYAGEEIDTFREKIISKLAKKICHSIRIAVLAEIGSEIFNIEPQ